MLLFPLGVSGEQPRPERNKRPRRHRQIIGVQNMGWIISLIVAVATASMYHSPVAHSVGGNGCQADQLQLSNLGSQGASMQIWDTFTIRNVSARSCRLSGSLRLAGVDRHGRRVTPVARIPTGTVLTRDRGAVEFAVGGPDVNVDGDTCRRELRPAAFVVSGSGWRLGLPNARVGSHLYEICGREFARFGSVWRTGPGPRGSILHH